MSNFRGVRKTLCGFLLILLVCLFLLTLQRQRPGNRIRDKDSLPISEDPVEVLLTEDDLARLGSEVALNATLGVCCEHRSCINNIHNN